MTTTYEIERVITGVKNLDTLLNGGLPKSAVIVIGGIPGGGKTTLAQQICFNNASPTNKVVVFQTLSEPSAKTIRYMSQFSFFDSKKLNDSVFFVDLGAVLREKGLSMAVQALMDHVKKVKPALVVVDSFKVFDDLSTSKEDLRKFTYDIAVNLMAWEVTAFLLGEFTLHHMETNTLSSVVDGIIMLGSIEKNDRVHRTIRIMKMRGTAHDYNVHSFEIESDGIHIKK